MTYIIYNHDDAYTITTTHISKNARWRMDFSEILAEKYRYAFTDAIVYISVRSIESEYNRIYQASNRKICSGIFASFMAREAAACYPVVALVYNFVMLNPKKTIMSARDQLERAEYLATVPLDKKIAHIIHEDPSTNNKFIHPMFAIMFALEIDQRFAVEIIGHISGMRLSGCDASTPMGHLLEELDEREISIEEYKRSAATCSFLIDELRGELSTSKREISQLMAANEQLRSSAENFRSAPKSAISRFCDRIRFPGRSRRVSPESFQIM